MSKARKIIGTTIRSVLIILFAVIITVVNTILPNYARMMDSMIGGINTQIDNSDVDTQVLILRITKQIIRRTVSKKQRQRFISRSQMRGRCF